MDKRLLILPVAIATATAVDASTVSASLGVNVKVVSSCQVGARALDFGLYGGRKVESASHVLVVCSRGAAYARKLDNGRNAEGNARNLANDDGHRLPYSLQLENDTLAVRSAGRDDDVEVLAVTGIGTGGATLIKVKGEIDDSHIAPPGIYSDVITVTVNF